MALPCFGFDEISKSIVLIADIFVKSGHLVITADVREHVSDEMQNLEVLRMGIITSRLKRFETRQRGVAAFLAGIVLFAFSSAMASFTDAEMKRIEAFARDNAMETAQVSPDGKHLFTIIRERVDTEPVLLIFETDKLAKRPVGVGADKMEIVSAFWANNERIVISFRQDIDTIERLGGATRQAFRIASVDVKGKRFVGLPRRNVDRRSETSEFLANLVPGSIFARLNWDPDHILMAIDTDQDNISDIYRVNVGTGSQTLVARGNERFGYTGIDLDGEVRLGSRYSPEDVAVLFYARKKGEKDWIEVGRTSAKGEQNATSIIFETLGFYNDDDPNELWVLSNHESDTAGIYAYDLDAQQFTELLFRHPEFDAQDVMTKLDADGRVVPIGFWYNEKTSFYPYLTDETEIALKAGVDNILQNSLNSLGSRSRDESIIIVRSEGPQRPPTWYMLKDKSEIVSLGTQRPELTSNDLSPAEWVPYEARDGRKIWSIVTIPKGEGPFPAVVLPHGGPIARDSWGFDPWSQILANFGYVVIQPQYRISEGFGREHLEAGFAQWGLTMQDDLDDAAAYLVERGLAEADNIAIFGWSYGGYASFIGAARDPNPYRCAIAGAGVADIPEFRARVGEFGSFAERSFRETLDGVDPLSVVDSVDVPILVIHGDIDERVPIEESDKFVAGLKRNNKQHEYLILEGANHFFGTIYYRHYMEMYPKMIDWLDNTCGMKN